MATRRAAFDAKQAANQARRLAREAEAAQEAAQRRAGEEARQAHRHAAYADAQHKQVRCRPPPSITQHSSLPKQQRVEAILSEEREREKMMQALRAARQQEAAAQRVARKVNQRLRVSKVESIQRMQAFRRHEALGRIEQQTQRARQLLEERNALKEERRQANIKASFQRQQLLEAMVMLTKAPGGNVDVHSVLQHV